MHPSQEAAARSLGLTRGQGLRYVILPQAVRRVIPPLLNDFIGLQKDTALVGTLGAVEAFQQSQIDTNATFNYTPYLAAALLFVAITIPLARFTDWLILRDRRRRQHLAWRREPHDENEAGRPPLRAPRANERRCCARSSSRACASRSGGSRCLRGIDLTVASTRSSA